MPKYRALHVKILDSQDFSDMPDDFTRVMWLLFIVALDSEGRGIDNPAWLRSRLFPYRQDINIDDIEKSMTWLADRKMINRYEVNGRRYFEVPTFKDYQPGIYHEARSFLPANTNPLPTNSEPTSNLPPTRFDSYTESTEYTELTNTVVVVEQTAGEIYKLYEQEIGSLTPMISQAISDAIDTYPSDWIKRAIETSARNNARNWSYTAKILQNWKLHGFGVDTRPKSSGNGKDKGVEDTLARLEKRRAASG